MNRQAFKQRMQNLKSYREQNPGKGYWDWRVQAYENAGETGDDYDPEKELKRSLNIVEYMLKHKKPLTDNWKVINDYVDKVLWTMENPNNNAYRDGKYYVYQDRGNDGVNRKNIGPGIESHSSIGQKLDYNGKTGYTREYLNGIVQDDLLRGTTKIVKSLNNMENGKYYGVWDTLSVGPKMTLYDIYHNVKNKNKKNLPESWPKLIESIATGDLENAKKETYSGSTRRQKMRNELLKYGDIDRVNNYADGGQTGEDKYNQQLSKLPQSKIGTEEKEWLRNWYQKRREYAKEHPYIANNMNRQLDAVQERFNVDPYTLDYYFEDGMKYPQRLAGYLNSVPIKIYEGNIPGEDPGLAGSYDPLAWYGDNIKLKKHRDKTTLLHELNHVLNVNNKPLLDNVRDRLGKQVMINDKYQVPFEENSRYEYYDDYLLDPAELHSRLTEFRYLNNLDPTKEYKLQDVKEWRKSAKDRELLDLLPDDNTILELINTIASTDNKESDDRVPMAKDGLQTGNDTPIIGTTTYNNYGDITHNIVTSFSDDTLNLGLPDVVVTPRDNLDLAGYVNNRMNNAARFGADIMDWVTPVGDIHQLYDVVNDTRSGDYLSAGIGLAALALPFSPMTVKQFRSLYRGITPKGRIKYNSKLMDQLLEKKIVDEDLYQQKKRNFYDRAIEDRNEVYDTWIENEDAFRRAVDFDKKYGTQYKKAYSDELKAYAKSPYSDGVTKIGVKSLGSANGKFYLEEPDWIFLNRDDIPMGAPQTGVVNHEMGHKIDSQAGVINRDGTIDKKLFNPTKFKSKEELLKQYSPDVVDRIQSYLLNDSEVKSHMNAFRTYLRRNKMLDPSGKENLKDFKKKLFDSGFDNLKILFNTYKKPRTFVRDFNAIPITKATTKTDKELV